MGSFKADLIWLSKEMRGRRDGGREKKGREGEKDRGSETERRREGGREKAGGRGEGEMERERENLKGAWPGKQL